MAPWYKTLRIALSILCENRYFLLWRKRPATLGMAYIANRDPFGPLRSHRTDDPCFGAPEIRSNRRGSRFFDKQRSGCGTRGLSTHAPRRISVRSDTAG